MSKKDDLIMDAINILARRQKYGVYVSPDKLIDQAKSKLSEALLIKDDEHNQDKPKAPQVATG